MEYENSIVLEIDPCPKPRMTQQDKWKSRPPVVRYRLFKNGLEHLALLNKYNVGDDLSLSFILKMPESWSNKKKEKMNGTPHQQKPDLDNLIKAFKDALCKDDSHVHTYQSMKKVWGYEGKIIIHNCNYGS